MHHAGVHQHAALDGMAAMGFSAADQKVNDAVLALLALGFAGACLAGVYPPAMKMTRAMVAQIDAPVVASNPKLSISWLPWLEAWP